MNKYEKMLKADHKKAAAVLKVLKVLDGKKIEDAKDILDAVKFFVFGAFFVLGASTFDNTAATDWINSLGGDDVAD